MKQVRKNLLLQLADRDIISHETVLERFKEIAPVEKLDLDEKPAIGRRIRCLRKQALIIILNTTMRLKRLLLIKTF